MALKKTVYLGRGAFMRSVEEMFWNRGWETKAHPESADFLCLLGGADIAPGLYGEKPLKGTYFHKHLDDMDMTLYHKFENQPKLGICRGGQFLNVLSGGKMWQHVNRHGGQHVAMDIRSQRVLQLSSIHHQMMIPGDDAEIIAVASMSTEKIKFDEAITAKTGEIGDDIEALYYPETQSLCFQPHPEIGPPECTQYFFDLIDEKYFGKAMG